ncbi:MAG: THUMP domain-containing class I SAM-dependent methyltransferase [Gaiellaceae bacterium]
MSVAEALLPILARTLRGVEWIAAAEVEAVLGPADISLGHRELRFSAELTPALLSLGTVDDIFLVAATTDGVDRTRESLSRLASVAKEIDLAGLARLLGRQGRTFDVVGSFVGKRNYSRYEIEDAVGSALETAAGWTYESRSAGAAARGSLSLRVHLVGSQATLALRIAAEPLHRRAYRVASRPGSLHPPLARALSLLAGLWRGAVLMDPFCGSGTIPIEAKLACRELRVRGLDLDPEAVAAARRNAAAANVEVELAVADAADLAVDSAHRLATNPPWGETVGSAGRFRLDPSSFVNELVRVLDPEGRAVFLAPPGNTLERAARSVFEVVLESRVRVSGAIAVILVFAHRDSGAKPIDPAGLFGRELVERVQARPAL